MTTVTGLANGQKLKTLLDWALYYHGLGWNIIPAANKRAIVPFKEYRERKQTEAEVRALFHARDCQIALLPGKVSGVVVVDPDSDEALKWCRKNGLSSRLFARTSKGAHFYFKYPDSKEIPNSVSKLYDKVDVRSDGGIAVLPPSLHGSGRRYTWNTFNGLPDSSLLNEAPRQLWAATSVRVIGPRNAEGWIAGALHDMRLGNIDDTLVRVLGKLRRDGYSQEDAQALLEAKALAAGATPDHLPSKIRHVWASYEAAPKEPETASPSSVEAFLAEETKVDWIVPDIVAKKSIGFIAGLPETGKTWIAMDLAIEAARGGKWLGKFQTKQIKTYFIDQERFKGETQRRFRSLLAGKGVNAGLVRSQLFIRCGSTIRLDLSHSFEAFRKDIAEIRPELVVIDSFATLHTSDENNRMEAQKIMEKLKALRDELGCSFAIIDHENKSVFDVTQGGDGVNAFKIVGSVGKVAAAEYALVIRKQADGISKVTHAKSSLAKAVDPFTVEVKDLKDDRSEIIVRAI